MKQVSGDVAHGYNAIRLDSFMVVNTGKLIEADEATGVVRWKDQTGEEKRVDLGAHLIRIMPRGHG